jgi:hypothetical protein
LASNRGELREDVTVAELTEGIICEVVGRDGMNRRHQDFQFSTAIDRIAHFSASCDIKGTRSP